MYAMCITVPVLNASIHDTLIDGVLMPAANSDPRYAIRSNGFLVPGSDRCQSPSRGTDMRWTRTVGTVGQLPLYRPYLSLDRSPGAPAPCTRYLFRGADTGEFSVQAILVGLVR
jgi:hypothetical protein